VAGTYTDIIGIDAPSSARAGEAVPVEVSIRNKYPATVHVAAVAVYDTEGRFIDWMDSWIPAGEAHSFSGSFVMPDREVIVHAYSYFEAAGGDWNFDDEAEKAVSLAEVFAGTLSRKELEYDGARAGIPVS